MPFEWTFYQEMLYQTSYVIFKYENTILHLEAIENAVEYQNLLWNVGEDQKSEGICLWAYSSKHSEILLAIPLREG